MSTHQHLGLNLEYVPELYPPTGTQNTAGSHSGNTTANPAFLPANVPLDAELAHTQARVRELEQLLRSRSQVPTNPMIADPMTILAAQRDAAESGGEGKKPVALPDIEPGMKSNAFDLPVPPRVDAAFRDYRYVPYTALSDAARLRAAHGEEEFYLNRSGSWTAKGLDRRDERNITPINWQAASLVAEDRTRRYHGDARADALHNHHVIVMQLAGTHGWEVAVEYDIWQREAAANNVRHDLSGLDTSCLVVISTRSKTTGLTTGAMPAMAHSSTPGSNSSLKRGANATTMAAPLQKRARTDGRCFRCGNSGHFPAQCTNALTITGRPVAALVTDPSRSPNTLAAADGRHYCFNFAVSGNCRFGEQCQNVHACSICGNRSHGAGGCTRRA
ncbi:hypothetical protein NEOLEDRAFT_1134049 [Neolentinus lepideus HHB14362 ss-1]|uniref:C3H1-type domain-containing protein n=1 Tax=Neolentinus lepideus HHB14362 ss-1 TaxID=1314782 RepID=A0A165SJ76_9AGAM|nr:hypothetical protein NEOLEDRAFT_1134049 [Neolentinus lepideus HHB14362 ss-1]